MHLASLLLVFAFAVLVNAATCNTCTARAKLEVTSDNCAMGHNAIPKWTRSPALTCDCVMLGVPLRSKDHISCANYVQGETTNYNIYVTSEFNQPINLFMFQEPADYSGGATVFSNSLATASLPAYNPDTTDQASFTLEVQYQAGAQKQLKSPQIGTVQSGKVSAAVVNLKSEQNPNGVSSSTSLVIDGQGFPDLTPPSNDDDVRSGAFRIKTPPFPPAVGPFNVGTATKTNGILTMSNFITATPNTDIDVQPIVQFYIGIGSYERGEVVDFSSHGRTSAKCDATDGRTTFFVTYKNDGTWELAY